MSKLSHSYSYKDTSYTSAHHFTVASCLNNSELMVKALKGK
jgi:hypothetical protein